MHDKVEVGDEIDEFISPNCVWLTPTKDSMSMTKPNILLIILDSVRAKNCGFHGHDNNTTPFLDSFLNQATVFKQAKSPSIHSISSHASIFSGFHTEEHNVTEHESRLSPDANIWKTLRDSYEYKTGMFSPNVVITESSNLSDVFDTYVGPRRNLKKQIFDDALSPKDLAGSIHPREYLLEAIRDEMPLRAIINGLHYKSRGGTSHDPERESSDFYINELLNWIEGRSGSWASCVNLMDAHYPYFPKERYNIWGGGLIERIHREIPSGPLSTTFLEGRPWGQLRSLESLYDGCIRQLDAALEHLIAGLKRAEEFENTLIVITSDHGEGFGERSLVTPEVRLVDHSWGIDEVLTHVPLIVKEPNQETKKEVDNIATLTNFPTVVRTAIDGQNPAKEFVPKDELVVSSTYRVREPGDELPINEENRKPYFGPWRAVYRENNGEIQKHVRRDRDEITLQIKDAQTAYTIANEDRGVIDQVFGEITDAGVKICETEGQEIDEEIEEKLADLGYLR